MSWRRFLIMLGLILFLIALFSYSIGNISPDTILALVLFGTVLVGILAGVLFWIFFFIKKKKAYAVVGSALLLCAVIVAIPIYFDERRGAINGRTKNALKNLNIAQEYYWQQYKIYCDNANRSALVTNQGWTSGDKIYVKILAADEDSWSVTASHVESIRRFTYSSSEVGIPE